MKNLSKIFGFVSFLIIYILCTFISCDNSIIDNSLEPVYYAVTFDSNGGSYVPPQMIENGKTAIKPNTPTRNNYKFSDWYYGDLVFDFSTLITQDIELTAHWIENISEENKKSYIVKHYQEKLDGTGYALIEEDSQILLGQIGDKTQAVAKSYEGFTAQSFSQSIIRSDGSTIVKIYYKRNIITLTFDIGDASWENGDTERIKILTGKYGTEVVYTFGLPYKPNCISRGWDKSLPKIFTTDETYTAVCVQSGQAHYKVKHYQQSINDNSYIEIEKDRQNLVGEVGATTTAVANDYKGFVVKSFSQKKISGDEITVVEIYYDRIEVTLTFLSNGGTWSDGTIGIKILKGRYGSSLNIELPVKTGYEAAWDEELQDTFTTNQTYSVDWIPTSINYTVEHYHENADNNNYSLYQTETLSGLCDSMTVAEAKQYEGFTAQSFSQSNIRADGSTVVKIYYKRNIITLTFDIADASWENGDTERIKTLTGKYGTEVVYTLGLPYKPNCISRGWDKSIPRIFTTDESFTAVCVQSGQAHYKVKHYQQAINDNSYIEIVKDQQNLVGDVGAMTVAAAKSYDGFTAKAFSQKKVLVDETTVVEIYYDRNEITLTFLPNGGTWTDGTVGVKILKGRYGASFDILPPVKNGHIATWHEELEYTFTTNKTYSVDWTARLMNYTVEHYLENADDDNYSLYQTETLSGLYDSETDAESKEFEDFISKSFEQKSITYNTVVKIYYVRKRYSLTFEKNDGSSDSVIVSAKQGAKVISYAPKFTRQYYQLSWEFDSSKQVTKDEVFVAQWTGIEVTLVFCANYEPCSVPYEYLNFKHGEPKTIPKVLFSRYGEYTLIGWATNENSTEIVYETEATITYHIGCGEPNTFYAVWQKPITVESTKVVNTIAGITDTGLYLIKITGTLTSSLREEINTAIESCPAKIQLDLSECQIVEWQTGETIDAVYAASVIGTFDDTSTHALKITGTLSSSLLSEIASVIKTRKGLIELDISETTGLQTLPNDCFKDCAKLKTVILPNGITTLGSCCFKNCTSLSSVSLPNSLTKIEWDVFYNCSSIIDIEIPVNVTEIGASAFAGTGITSIVIPKEIKSLSSTFKDCKNLLEVTLPNTIESLYRTFQNCTSLQNLTIPNSIETLNGTFIGCTSLTNIDIPSSIKTIGDYAFDSCGLSEISIPRTVTSIGKNAFSNCRKLESIVIPNSITEISDETFWGCDKLSSVTIPNSVTKIGKDAFGLCVSLTSITIPDSVTSIGSGAFSETSLSSIVIPNSVTSIENGVFYKCASLTSITIPDSVTSIGPGAFERCTSLSSITIPDSVTDIGEYAFSETAIREITLPSGITELCKGTFYGCKSLQRLKIPAAVESIAPRVFFDTYISSIYFENQKNWVYRYESGTVEEDIDVSSEGWNAIQLSLNSWAMNGIRIKKQ